MFLELALLGGAVLLLRSQPRQLAPSTPPAAKDPVPSTNGNPDTTAGGPSVEEILKSDELKAGAGAASAAASSVGLIAIPIVATGAAMAVAIVGVVDAFNAAASRDELLRNRAGAGNKFEWDTGNLANWLRHMRAFDRGEHGFGLNRMQHQVYGLIHGQYLPVRMESEYAAWFYFADGYARKFDYTKTLKLPDGTEGLEIQATKAVTEELLKDAAFAPLAELQRDPAQEIRILTPLVDDSHAFVVPPPPPLPQDPAAPPPGAYAGPPPPAPGTSPPVESLAPAEVVKATQPVASTPSSAAPAPSSTSLAASGSVMQFIGYVPPSGGFGSF